MILEVVLVILGFILLIKGADFLVDGSSNIAKKFHIPEIIIGLTIVSIGTSMPELFVSITSALEEHSDMAVGNVIGSNLCNLLLILGLSAVIKKIEFKRETRLIEIPIMLLVTILLLVMSNTDRTITHQEGIILIIWFVLFILYTIYMAKKGEQFDKENTIVEMNSNTSNTKIIQDILYIILGIVGLKIGGDLVVNNSIEIARNMHISEKIISLTIIAVGTSLPELVTSITAAFKNNSDIAIGNIVGSNIFNILLILGTSAVLSPIAYSVSYNNQLLVLIISTILLALFPFIGEKNTMTRGNGLSYLIIYIIYLVGIFAI